METGRKQRRTLRGSSQAAPEGLNPSETPAERFSGRANIRANFVVTPDPEGRECAFLLLKLPHRRSFARSAVGDD